MPGGWPWCLTSDGWCAQAKAQAALDMTSITFIYNYPSKTSRTIFRSYILSYVISTDQAPVHSNLRRPVPQHFANYFQHPHLPWLRRLAFTVPKTSLNGPFRFTCSKYSARHLVNKSYPNRQHWVVIFEELRLGSQKQAISVEVVSYWIVHREFVTREWPGNGRNVVFLGGGMRKIHCLTFFLNCNV